MTHVDDVVPVGLNQAFVRVLQDAGFSDHSVEVVMSALYFYGVGISANVLPMRGTKTFENVDAETLFADGVDLLLAGARQLLDADLAAR
jgi:hypothetical protein